TILEKEIFAEFDEFMAMTADENSESESDIEEPPFEKITISTVSANITIFNLYNLFMFRIDIKDHSFSPNFKIELFLFNSNNCISSVKTRSSQDEGNFAASSILTITKSSRKVNLSTSTSIFSAIPTGYWNDLSVNITETT
nr:hypothetical protein [Tanacetum cinerariifolium]